MIIEYDFWKHEILKILDDKGNSAVRMVDVASLLAPLTILPIFVSSKGYER